MVLKPRQLHILLFLLCCLGLAALSIILNKSIHLNYFENFNQQVKLPVSKLNQKVDLKILKDFFNPDTFGRLVEYKLETKSFADESNLEIVPILNKKIKDSLSSTIMGHINEEISKEFNPFIIQKLISTHQETLISVGTGQAKLQTDLYFIPQASKSFNFDSELSTNGLINHSKATDLFDFIHKKKSHYTQDIYQLKLPSNGNTFQFLGGVISIWSESKDFFEKPDEKVKEDFKENFKGEVRYRRYFRVNRLVDLDFLVNHPDFKINVIHFKSEEFQQAPIITVDVIKNFDLTNIHPQLKKMDIHFGEIIPSKFFVKDQGLQILEEEEKPILTGKLYIKGETPDTQYKAQLKTLSWSFNDEYFSNDSKTIIELIKPRYDSNYGLLKNGIRNKILLKNAPTLIKNFKLNRFHKLLGVSEERR